MARSGKKRGRGRRDAGWDRGALATRGSCTSRHANAVGAVAELVLFTDDVASFVGALAGCGVATAKGRPPRAVKAAPEFVMARYFLQPQLRVLILGPGQHPALCTPSCYYLLPD